MSMPRRTGKTSVSLIFLLSLSLFLLLPGGFLYSELDEPPQGTDRSGAEVHVDTLGGGEGKTLRRNAAGESGIDDGKEEGQTAVLEDLRRGVLISVSWVFLVVALVLVSLTLRKSYLWLMAVQKAKVPPTRYFNLQLQVRGRDGALSLHNFDYYPVIVAAKGTADLLLPGLSRSEDRFRIDYHRGQAHLFTDSSVIVNGVPRQQKPLKQGDRIVFGSYRLDFKDASIREQPSPIPGKPVFAWQFPIVALLLALSVLFKQAGALPEDTMLAKAAQMQSAEQRSEGRDIGVTEGVIPAEEEAKLTAEQSVAKADDRPNLLKKFLWIFNSSETKDIEFAEDRRQDPAIREQGSVEVTVAKVQAPRPSRQPTPVVESSSKRKELREENAASRVDTQVTRVGRNGVSSSGQVAPAARPAPPREPVVSGEFPADTVVDVPAPRSADSASPGGGDLRKDMEPGDGLTVTGKRAVQQPPMLQASVLGTVAPRPNQIDGINPLEGLSFEDTTRPEATPPRTRSVPDIGRTKVRVVAPGRPVEFFKADILFIHAHPDDESIDFGSLMAKASRSGKRIVTLLFTDGESGLDLYPQRKVGDIYPARILKDGALSQVRVVEATRALSILGSEMYLRWGLENRPYNTQRDVVAPEEIIRGWGGEEHLLSRLIEVLDGFQPAIVVSPDSRSKAYEHFEHEAVGQLVKAAVQRLLNSGRSYVKGHLVSIDPYQVDRYSGVTGVDAQGQDSESGFAYRAIQTLALKEHVSQRDASVIGVSRLSNLPREYYKASYWDLGDSLEQYLKDLDR